MPATTCTTDRHDTDDPAAAVSAAAHAYEQALVVGDTAAASAWFEDSDAVSRFGPEGAQYGRSQVAALRAAAAPARPATWRHEAVTELGQDTAVHIAELDRDGVTIQRTQVWRRGPDGWRIVHAHVSRPSS